MNWVKRYEDCTHDELVVVCKGLYQDYIKWQDRAEEAEAELKSVEATCKGWQREVQEIKAEVELCKQHAKEELAKCRVYMIEAEAQTKRAVSQYLEANRPAGEWQAENEKLKAEAHRETRRADWWKHMSIALGVILIVTNALVLWGRFPNG